MADEMHYKELNDRNLISFSMFLGEICDSHGTVKKKISMSDPTKAKNENPPKFSTKGDCHVYSWL